MSRPLATSRSAMKLALVSTVRPVVSSSPVLRMTARWIMSHGDGLPPARSASPIVGLRRGGTARPPKAPGRRRASPAALPIIGLHPIHPLRHNQQQQTCDQVRIQAGHDVVENDAETARPMLVDVICRRWFDDVEGAENDKRQNCIFPVRLHEKCGG